MVPSSSPGEGGTTLPDLAARWGFAPHSPLLRRALTHRSVAPITESNERLEFLGDALLGAFVARFVYEKLPEDSRESVLSRSRVAVVRRETLAQAAREIGLSPLLSIGPGERKERRETNDSLLADAYEALTAAVYLECGPETMERFLCATLAGALEAIVAAPPSPDPKTFLQMRLQALGRGTPTYNTIETTPHGHRQPHFHAEALAADGAILAEGEGSSRRAAETEAARVALELL